MLYIHIYLITSRFHKYKGNYMVVIMFKIKLVAKVEDRGSQARLFPFRYLLFLFPK